MLSMYKAAAGGAIAFCALTLTSVTTAKADCTPLWAEEVGLPAQFVPRVWDFVTFDDGTGETLYAAGLLDVGPPNERTGAVKWNGQTWEALEVQGPGNFASSVMLAVYNGELYGAGGYGINGQNYRVARWDTVASDWVPVSSAIPQFFTVFTGDAMVAFDGALYIGGRHDSTQGIGSNNFSRYDGSTWGPVPNLPAALTFSAVQDLFVFDGSLYASYGSLFAGGSVYRLDEDGGTWQQVGGTVPATNRMASFQNELYIAGTNSQFQLPVVDHVMRLVNGNWEAIPSPSNYQFTFIETLASANDGSGEALYVGGTISDFGGVNDVNHVAKWDGTSWSSLGGGVLDDNQQWDNARVMALHGWTDSAGPALWVGGEFYFVDNDGDVLASAGIGRWGCEPPPVDPVLSTVVASASAISSFSGIAQITVTPRNEDNLLLDAGQEVVISVDAGTLLGAVTDQGNGTYTQDLLGDASAGTEVRVAVNGIELNDAPFITFVPVEPSLSGIAMSIDQTFLGGTAVITVTLLDDQGAPAGSGFDVNIATTVGELAGSVVDHGDGTYSQTVIADETGTASITATVDGMALNTSAALSVLDPANIGSIIGYNSQGDPVGFLSIQAAIDAALSGGTVFIAPGTYNETILLDDESGLIIEGLSALEPVSIRGVVISESNDLSIRYLTIDPDGANRPRDAVEVRGGPRASDGIEIIGSTITNAAASGIAIDRGNTNVRIVDSTITGNGRHGISFGRDGEGVIVNSTISENGWSGLDVDRDVFVTIENNVITGNGHFFNNANPNGYGIARARHGANGNPQQITLINNTLANNNGRVQNNRSDYNVGNYDQIIDPTDDQSPYTD